MLRFTLRRMGQLVVVLAVLSLLIFFWLRALPGGIAASICGERCTPQLIADLTRVLGLDQPLIVQYFKYIGRIFQGDFGTSARVIPGRPALSVFFERFPATIELGICAMLFALGLGIPLGYLAARRRGSVLDNAGVIGTLVGIAVPVFFLAYLLKLYFAVKLNWLPPSGRQDPTINATRVTGFFVLDGLLTREWDAAWDAFKHLILPAIALGTIPLAVIFRITRSSVLDVLDEDYVRTAEAKGLSAPVIRRRHVLRNAMLPVITVTGLQAGALLAGAVLTETIFNFPGIGAAITQSFREKDYPVLQVVILAAAITYVLINLIVDLGYALIDPRIRVSGGAPVIGTARKQRIDLLSEQAAQKDAGVSLLLDAWRRVRTSPVFWVGFSIIALFLLLALSAGWIATQDPAAQLLRSQVSVARNQVAPAQPGFPWGSDFLGRDLFSRMVLASRQTLLVGVAATLLGLIGGMILGLLAGAFGGWVDTLVMRLVDVMLSVPSLLLAISIAVLFTKPNQLTVIIAVSVVQIPVFARLLRGQMLAQRHSDHVLAATALGVKQGPIVFRHMLPNSLSPVIVQATIVVATSIIDAAALSFLGLGSQDAAAPEWGQMLGEAQSKIDYQPHLAVLPAIAIIIVALGFTLLGESLREALDPKNRR